MECEGNTVGCGKKGKQDVYLSGRRGSLQDEVRNMRHKGSLQDEVRNTSRIEA